MSSISECSPPLPIPVAHQEAKSSISTWMVLMLAISTGVSVASVYYCQPMLGILGPALHASDKTLGLVPTLTQLGYALGILLLAPLGDRVNRKKLILIKGTALIASLLLAGLSPNIYTLLVASFAIGLATTVAQDIVPAAATLAPESSRGKVVGSVMTGLLLGILLSRVVSGTIAELFGWRTMFVSAAGLMAVVLATLNRFLPNFVPTTSVPYRQLLSSLGTLWKQHPSLRSAALAQGLLAVGFSAFWSTLAILLHGAPFHLGSAAAGAFGLAGAAGALAAPLAGIVADKRGPSLVTQLGSALVAITFAAMAVVHFHSPQSALIFLAITAVTFDLGVQASLISHQSIIYSIDPGSRSRLNAVLFTIVFSGMAIGSAMGGQLLAQFGWTAVCLLSFIAALIAFMIRVKAGAALRMSSSRIELVEEI